MDSRADLAPGEVHVWTVALDQPEARLKVLARTLSADELERAGRFRFARDANRFTAARAALRAILGRYLGVHPAAVAFVYGPHGKPAVAARVGESELGFNLTHSGELALVAVTLGRAIGVDLEAVRPFEEVDEVPATIFSARSLTKFESLPPTQRASAFFNAWTRKEAYVKATGLGFSTNVAEVEVTFAPGVPAALVSPQGDSETAGRWALREVAVGPRYAAALALRGSIVEMRRLQFDHTL